MLSYLRSQRLGTITNDFYLTISSIYILPAEWRPGDNRALFISQMWDAGTFHEVGPVWALISKRLKSEHISFYLSCKGLYCLHKHSLKRLKQKPHSFFEQIRSIYFVKITFRTGGDRSEMRANTWWNTLVEGLKSSAKKRRCAWESLYVHIIFS